MSERRLFQTPPASATSSIGGKSSASSWLPWRRAAPTSFSKDDKEAPTPLSFDTPATPPLGPSSTTASPKPSPLAFTDLNESPPPQSPKLQEFQNEIQKLISCSNLDGVLDMLQREYAELELPSKPDSRFTSVLLDVLCFLADHEQEDVTGVKKWLDSISEMASAQQTLGSTFLRGIDVDVLVRLLLVRQTAIRACAYSFFARTYNATRPWSLAHREKQMPMVEAFFHSMASMLTVEWCEAFELFLMTSLLNSPADAHEDAALAYFELQGGYELILKALESPHTSEEVISALIDLLRGLTYLGGTPHEFQDAYRVSNEENSLDAVSEAKNFSSFTCICRLVSKMLEDASVPSTIRLPLLHSVMSIFEANPKNFGILERQFQLLSQLSKHLGEENVHDELLFMCVKLFELVGLGFEYRPISAVTALCEPNVLMQIALRRDERTFSVLSNTLVKLVSRHPSLAMDSGLMKNVLFPLLQRAEEQTTKPILLNCLALLASCLERHPSNCSESAKPIVFENNCAFARNAQMGMVCKDLVLGCSEDSTIVTAAVQVMFLLAKDVNGDLQLMLELLQTKSTIAFRTVLFEQCIEVLKTHDELGSVEIWPASGVAMFDCVLTVLLSLESAFTTTNTDEEYQLLLKTLLFLHESFKHGNAVDFDSLYPVLKLSGILSSSRASDFIQFMFDNVIVYGQEIENSEPLVLLGFLAGGDGMNDNDSAANLLALTLLRDLVAHDGEASCWNRQQVAKIRGAEKLVQQFSPALLNPEHNLHQVLVQIVGCVGNFAATPELLDSLLRLAYRSAADDDEDEPSQPPRALESMLEVLKLVAEPKIVGRHVILNAHGARADLVPCFSQKSWPPPLASSSAEASYSLSTWFSLSAAANSKQKTLFTMYSSSVLLLSVVLERVEEMIDDANSNNTSLQSLEFEGVSSMGMGIAKHSIVVSTSSGQTRLLPIGEDLYPGRWHHLVLVHRKTAGKTGGLASFWKAGSSSSVMDGTSSSTSTDKGGPGTIDVYLNGEKLETASLNWPSPIESANFVVKLGWEEERLLLGRTMLFEGGLKSETIAGLFLRGPSYRGSLNKVNPMFQDKKAVITSAFERVHFLARDDDFFNRMDATGWMDIQRFISAALSARADPKSVSLAFQFDPEDDVEDDELTFRILPQPMQETLCSFGGSSRTLFPLLLRVGSNSAGEDSSVLVCAVLTLLRDSLRGSDRARFLFRFDDGHRVLAWLLHLICEHQENRTELFRIALSFSTIGMGFDATLIDAEALFLVAMNDHVWRDSSATATTGGGEGMAWELVSELLLWLDKLLHLNNRHRLVNFAVLQTIHVFDWVFGQFILLVRESESHLKRKRGLELVSQLSNFLERLLRCDLGFVPLVFEFVLATLSSSNEEEEEDASSLHPILRKSSLHDLGPPTPTPQMMPSAITLSDIRNAMLDLLIRLREPRTRASQEEASQHLQRINELYIKLAAGDWIWAVLDRASNDYASVLAILSFCESEIASHGEFKLALANSKAFSELAAALCSGAFANTNAILLLWARLCSGGASSAAAAQACRNTATKAEDVSLLQEQLYEVLTLPNFGKFVSLSDVTFGAAVYDGLLAQLRHNMQLATKDRVTVNAHMFRFLWSCSQASAGLTKLWTSSASLKVLVRSLFIHDQFTSAVQVDEPFGPFEFLLDLIIRSSEPGETFRLACGSFPEDSTLEQIQHFQLKMYLGCFDHAQICFPLALVMIQRCCLGWTPTMELNSLRLAVRWEGTISLAQSRSLVLCTLDRNLSASAEEVQILNSIRTLLPSLVGPGTADADAFVACLVRCVFYFAYEQASASTQGKHAEETEFAWWTFFIAICRLVPELVRRLYHTASTTDIDLVRAQEAAHAGLNSETKMDWILTHFGLASPLRQILTSNCYATWTREMEAKTGKWYVAGRASLVSNPTAVLTTLVENNAKGIAAAAAASASSNSASRLRGWGSSSSVGKPESFFKSGGGRHSQIILQARMDAFTKLEQLFSSQFEDMLRGEKSWSRILRRATLPNLPWEPYGGRRPELEEQTKRWKLDPFEDPYRQRLRLRPNNTFYKRYNLTALKAKVATTLIESPSKQVGGASRKRLASPEMASTPTSPPPQQQQPMPPLGEFEFHNEATASPSIIQALRRRGSEHQQPESRARTQTLVSIDEAGAATNEEDDDDAATMHSDEMEEEEFELNAAATLEDVNFFSAEKDDFVLVPDVVSSPKHTHEERVRSAMDAVDWDATALRINCSTVRGLEERIGLCIIARTSLYVLDNYQIDVDGSSEIIEIHERESRFNVQLRSEDVAVALATATTAASLDIPAPSHRSRRVRYDEILDMYRRRFLFRDVGLEIFSSNGGTLFLVFGTAKERDRVLVELKKARRKTSLDLPFNDVSPRAKPTLADAKRMWVNGQLSNFDYLMLLNTLAGRSFNDPAQYLVFPWVLRDYESDTLDLDNPASFRDLSKPMGAMTPERVAYATDRYMHLETEAATNHLPAFHFGSHYSCSGYVANYLVRLEPFSRMALQLQGGEFDHPDRLFRSIEMTWKSASGASMQDVRELVPEFFMMHEFLENRNKFELGTTYRGIVVDDVELPKWAHGSAMEFIRLHRKALESRFVCEHLNEWIDLVFGYKQRGREAIKAVNVFHPLTYEGEVDLDAIEDPTERASAMEQIHSFGQTPKRLFETHPHPKREWQADKPSSCMVAPLIIGGAVDRPAMCTAQGPFDVTVANFTPGECQMVCVEDLLAESLTQQFASAGPTVCEMMWDESDRLVVLRGRSTRRLTHLITPTKYVSFGDRDGSLRVHSCTTTLSTGAPLRSSSGSTSSSGAGGALDTVLVAFEDLHRGRITCAFVVDFGKLFVTGGEDGAVRIWRLRKNQDIWRLEHEATNIGHPAASSITCLFVCKEQGIAVSGANDGSIAVWDWGKRQEYIRGIKAHNKPVKFVGVNALNGNIITVCEREAKVWHINGQLIATANEFRNMRLATPTACFVVPCYSHVPGIVLVLGHANGDVSLWDLSYISDNTSRSTKLELRALLPSSSSGDCAVVSLLVSKDGRTLVAANARGELKRWMTGDVALKKYKAQQPGPAAVLAAQTIKTLVNRNSLVLGGASQQQQQTTTPPAGDVV